MKLIYSLFFCLISSILFSQESEIIISEAKLQQLADKLYQLKLERQTANMVVLTDDSFLENPRIQERIKRLQQNEKSETNQTSVNEQIKNLQTEIRLLRELLLRQEKNKESFTVNTITSEKGSPHTNASTTQNNDEEILNRLEEISVSLKNIEQEKEETTSRIVPREERIVVNVPRTNNQGIVIPPISKTASDTVYISEWPAKKDSLALLTQAEQNRRLQEQENALTKITTQLHLLHQKIDDLFQNLNQEGGVQIVEIEKVIPAKNTISEEDEAYQKRQADYGEYKLQVFFANNSFSIAETYIDAISELKKLLNNEPKIDVLIEGYASNRGDILYNEELSMKRAIALKRKLMNVGIAPERILTDYKGVDKKATSENEARRLDVSFLVRK